jgi:hypothetical protein
MKWWMYKRLKMLGQNFINFFFKYSNDQWCMFLSSSYNHTSLIPQWN